MAAAAAVAAVPVAAAAVAVVAADAGKRSGFARSNENPAVCKHRGVLFFEKCFSFQHSTAAAASAPRAYFAISRTGLAQSPCNLGSRRNSRALVRILNVKVMATMCVKEVSSDGGARSS